MSWNFSKLLLAGALAAALPVLTTAASAQAPGTYNPRQGQQGGTGAPVSPGVPNTTAAPPGDYNPRQGYQGGSGPSASPSAPSTSAAPPGNVNPPSSQQGGPTTTR